MRIGIIGAGGAGLCAAWLLEQDHEVVVFERNAVPGGHARTTSVDRGGIAHASDGFNWFSEAMYPRFMRLLELVGQPTVRIPMSCTFTDLRTSHSLCMPPIGVRRFSNVLLRPSGLLTLLKMFWAVKKAGPIVHGHRTGITCREFLADLSLGDKFEQDFLLPLMSGTWGCPHERTVDCDIYPLMKYFVFHAPNGLSYYWWHVAEGGAGAYAKRMADQLSSATLHLDAKVERVRTLDAGFEVTSLGETHTVDALVVAAGAADAKKILTDTEGIEAAKAALDRFEYYTAFVATHSDPSYMPPNRKDWSVANVRWDGERADLTVWSGYRPPGDDRPPVDLFTTYVAPGEEPKDMHHLSRFSLPLETPQHYEAQEDLRAAQGQSNLWFAGDYTQDIGSHEDAICSAIRVAEQLAPGSKRLAEIKKDRAPLAPA